jgi:hypothetical protein
VTWLDNIAWRGVRLWLERYCRGNTTIRHCFIRHSTAWSPQNLWVSDYDLAFFVEATSFREVQLRASAIREDLRRGLILDAIVLPANPKAYNLCATHYVHRSLYPMNHWRHIYGGPITISDAASPPLPLDHCPEGFLYGYVTPILQGKKRPRLGHRTMMKRKLERESMQITGAPPRDSASELYGVVAEEIRLWDEFYRTLSSVPTDGQAEVWPVKDQPHLAFADRWAKADWPRSKLPGVASVWIYPSFRYDSKPYVVLNFDRAVSRDDCRTSIVGLVKTFEGLDFELLLGTERSMVGRLAGLSRVTLLEPWLREAFGQCVYGDKTAAQKIREPSADELREKLREYFLYLSYRVFPGGACPYSLYRLCFTLDYFFRRRELVLDSEDLADIYGREFLQKSQFEGSERRERVLEAFKSLHGLHLF